MRPAGGDRMGGPSPAGIGPSGICSSETLGGQDPGGRWLRPSPQSALATALGLIPLYSTKIVLDNVLAGLPWARGLSPLLANRRMLLTVVAVSTVAISAIAVNTWSRWQTTRVTKRVQTSVRRKVFDHAARLPLHRVYELKSGGVASILREDAGGIADLIFAMLYNPWRAIIQLCGSLIILAWVDWRLLLCSLTLIPIVLASHSTWVTRIRPLFRSVRAIRQHVDSHATETFGGMRVVRSFSRQRTESGQFVRNNDTMVRQEIVAWWWMRGIELAWSMLIPIASGGAAVVRRHAHPGRHGRRPGRHAGPEGCVSPSVTW